jgi:hypothetical protein
MWSYAVHVIDLYEHHLMRARLEEKIRKDIMAGKLKSYEEAVAQAVQHGLLTLGDGWQDKRLANKAQSSMAYFLANASKAGAETTRCRSASSNGRSVAKRALAPRGVLIIAEQ